MLARKALAGTAGAPKVYVEEVFSTFLYRGTGSAQTITNNIDLSTEGGLVWLKSRTEGAAAYDGHHYLFDTARGTTKSLRSNGTNSEETNSQTLTAFTTSGFSIGTTANINNNTHNFASWTFRKAKKFFDVVTYTGNASSRTISHNLGSVPGTIIVKCTSEANDWVVYHRSFATPASSYLKLNTTDAVITGNTNIWDNTAPTSSVFSVGASGFTNNSGQTYVAYLFAHDAGGFGDAGSDNVISCGSYTGTGAAGNTITLGYEPQWLLVKRTDSVGINGNWFLFDNMRGFPVGNAQLLMPSSSNAESSSSFSPFPSATGFYLNNSDSRTNESGGTYIYIAIRRGPMKTPTSGTSVYTGVTRTGTGAAATITGVGFAPDLYIGSMRTSSVYPAFVDRLRGNTKGLASTATAAETTSSSTGDVTAFGMDGISLGTNDQLNFNINTVTAINWFFRRAPGFFDVVCYTGTGSATTFSHNLGVAPELMIVKQRDSTNPWRVYSSPTGATKHLALNTNAAETTSSANWNDTAPTSTVFTVGTGTGVNGSGSTYVNYLFASVSGVSKVGSYTGNGSSVTVTTDFQPRFIMVKRTDSTGDWLVSDSARGLVAGNDPYLELNTTDAEVTNEDWVDISSTSFTVNQTTNNANVNTGTYIYLAIA